MSDSMPKLDREKLMEELLAEAERTVNEVADAVDNAPAGRVIAIAKSRLAMRWIVSASGLRGGYCRRRSMRRKPLFPPPESAATGKRKRHKGRQAYSVLTINGRVRLLRVRWHCPEEGSETPIDRLIDQAESSISEGVREMACRVNQDRRASKRRPTTCRVRRTFG